MSDKIIENNQVTIIGEIASEFTFSHEVFGEGFYMTEVLVNRLSHQTDVIPLMVSERLMDVSGDYIGQIVEATLKDPCCGSNPMVVEDFMVRRILEEVTGHV